MFLAEIFYIKNAPLCMKKNPKQTNEQKKQKQKTARSHVRVEKYFRRILERGSEK